jgi:hypothetical protein
MVTKILGLCQIIDMPLLLLLILTTAYMGRPKSLASALFESG